MKRILILLCLPMIGFGQQTGCISGNCQNGYGTYITPNGDKYVGEWKDGKQNGQGKLDFISGNKYVGEWKDGERWNGTLYDKEGKIIGKFMNGWFDQ